MLTNEEKIEAAKQEIKLLKLVNREVEKLSEKRSQGRDGEDLEVLEQVLKQI